MVNALCILLARTDPGRPPAPGARLPDGVRWGHVMGVGAVAGIGFTVSLFITGLAFDDVAMRNDAKIGILAASIIAALAGAAILAVAARASAPTSPSGDVPNR